MFRFKLLLVIVVYLLVCYSEVSALNELPISTAGQHGAIVSPSSKKSKNKNTIRPSASGSIRPTQISNSQQGEVVSTSKEPKNKNTVRPSASGSVRPARSSRRSSVRSAGVGGNVSGVNNRSNITIVGTDMTGSDCSSTMVGGVTVTDGTLEEEQENCHEASGGHMDDVAGNITNVMILPFVANGELEIPEPETDQSIFLPIVVGKEQQVIQDIGHKYAIAQAAETQAVEAANFLSMVQNDPLEESIQNIFLPITAGTQEQTPDFQFLIDGKLTPFPVVIEEKAALIEEKAAIAQDGFKFLVDGRWINPATDQITQAHDYAVQMGCQGNLLSCYENWIRTDDRMNLESLSQETISQAVYMEMEGDLASQANQNQTVLSTFLDPLLSSLKPVSSNMNRVERRAIKTFDVNHYHFHPDSGEPMESVPDGYIDTLWKNFISFRFIFEIVGGLEGRGDANQIANAISVERMLKDKGYKHGVYYPPGQMVLNYAEDEWGDTIYGPNGPLMQITELDYPVTLRELIDLQVEGLAPKDTLLSGDRHTFGRYFYDLNLLSFIVNLNDVFEGTTLGTSLAAGFTFFEVNLDRDNFFHKVEEVNPLLNDAWLGNWEFLDRVLAGLNREQSAALRFGEFGLFAQAGLQGNNITRSALSTGDTVKKKQYFMGNPDDGRFWRRDVVGNPDGFREGALEKIRDIGLFLGSQFGQNERIAPTVGYIVGAKANLVSAGYNESVNIPVFPAMGLRNDGDRFLRMHAGAGVSAKFGLEYSRHLYCEPLELYCKGYLAVAVGPGWGFNFDVGLPRDPRTEEIPNDELIQEILDENYEHMRIEGEHDNYPQVEDYRVRDNFFTLPWQEDIEFGDAEYWVQP